TGRLLEVGQLKAYPVRPFTLLVAELVARMADPLTLGTLTGLLALHVGLALSRPDLLPRLVVLFVLHAFVLLCSQFVLGELLAAIARRARIALVMVFVFAMGFSPRVAAWLDAGNASSFARLERLSQLLQLLPSTRLLAAPSEGWQALLFLLEGLLGPLVLLLAGVWVMNR